MTRTPKKFNGYLTQVEYIQDFFDSISSFFLGDSAQQAEREDDDEGEYDYGGEDDDDYR